MLHLWPRRRREERREDTTFNFTKQKLCSFHSLPSPGCHAVLVVSVSNTARDSGAGAPVRQTAKEGHRYASDSVRGNRATLSAVDEATHKGSCFPLLHRLRVLRTEQSAASWAPLWCGACSRWTNAASHSQTRAAALQQAERTSRVEEEDRWSEGVLYG